MQAERINPATTYRSKPVTFKTTRHDAQLIQERATNEGKTVSQFVNDLVTSQL